MEILLIGDGPHQSLASLLAATSIAVISQFTGWWLISRSKLKFSSIPVEQFAFYGLVLLLSAKLLDHYDTGVIYAGFLLTLASILGSYWAYRRDVFTEKSLVISCLVAIGFFGILCRLHSLWLHPLGSISDMLPLIQQSLSVFLDSMDSPYKTPLLITGVAGLDPYFLNLTYLPLKWLAYLPTFLMDVDLRYTNIAMDLLIFFLILKSVTKLNSNSTSSLWLVACLFSAYFLNDYVIQRLDAEIYIYSFLLALLAYSFIFWSEKITYIILGLMLATNQLTLLLIPFVVTYDLYHRGLRSTLKGFVLTALVCSTVVVPFMLVSLEGMLNGIVYHWSRLENFPASWAAISISNINFSVLLFELELQYSLKFIQLLLSSGLFTVFIFKRYYKSLYLTLLYMFFCTFLFLLFNIVVWTYLFEPLFVLAGFVLVAKLMGANKPAITFDSSITAIQPTGAPSTNEL